MTSNCDIVKDYSNDANKGANESRVQLQFIQFFYP